MKRPAIADLPLRVKGLIAIALPVVALLLSITVLGVIEAGERDAEQWVRHTFEVRADLQLLLTLMVDAETGVRGYLLTQRAEWLEPYETAVSRFPSVISHLDKLLSNPTQRARLQDLRRLAGQRMRHLTGLRAAPRYGAVLQRALDSGRQAMDAVRRVITAMQADEDQLLAERRGHAEAQRRWTDRLIFLTAVVGLAGGLLAAVLFSVGIASRVDALRENAALLARREPLLKIPESKDEIGRLANALAAADSLLSEREAALKEARNFVEHLIETSPAVIFRKDPRTMEVTYVSPNVQRVLGYAPQEVLQSPDFWFQRVHPGDRERILEENRSAIGGGATQVETEYRLRHKNGEYRWMRSFVRLEYGPDGMPQALLGHRLDITERKQVEQDLVESRAVLDAANKELEAFSYSVSHDLRAPLRSIDGFSQALMEDYAEKFDEAGRKYLVRVRAATERMGQLIDDLLQLSKVTRGPLHREQVDLSRIADAIASELRDSDPGRQVEFRIRPGVTANADAGLMRLVLENLLGNAWKFTSKHERARIVFDAYRHGFGMVYYVRDDGAGFDPNYGAKLFAAFQRLHGATDFEGTGIGLATVQRIVLRHAGRVWAEGEVEKGATFYFTLRPAAMAAPVADNVLQ